MSAFQREKDIRSGKLDNAIPGYEEMTGWFQRCPITWLPGLLIHITKQCVVRSVFKDKEALLRMVDRSATNVNDFLREENGQQTSNTIKRDRKTPVKPHYD